MTDKVISKSYRKVVVSGTTHYVSIPRGVREIMDVKKADRIMVAFYYDKVPSKKVKEEVKKKEVDEISMFTKDEEEDSSGLPVFDFDGK